MTYGSVCSGIETATLAFPKNWQAKWLAEVDPFCCAVLKHHYPNVLNHGDIKTHSSFEAVDVVVGGTPCQSFSIQGLRQGLADPRGGLTRRFVEVVRESSPRWVIWENVPGVLSSQRGRAVGCLVRGFSEIGYQCAWRVLDAQYFGSPQRRRRLFIVANRGINAGPVLFEGPQHPSDSKSVAEIQERRRPAGEVNGSLLGWTGDETPKWGIEVVPTLRASQGGEGVGVWGERAKRRLTITEWERLQGVPVGYTEVPGATESKRRRALGNAFCVPVMNWIAQRIETIEGMTR